MSPLNKLSALLTELYLQNTQQTQKMNIYTVNGTRTHDPTTARLQNNALNRKTTKIGLCIFI